MRSQVSPAQLRALVAVSRAGSLQAACAPLDHSGKTNLVQLLGRLDDWLSEHAAVQVHVLEPSGHLTDEGRALVTSAAAVLRSIDAFNGQVRDLTRSSRVLVGCYPAHVPLLARAGQRLARAGRNVHVRLHEIDDAARGKQGLKLLENLVAGRCDLVIVQEETAALATDELVVRHLYKATLMAVFEDSHERRDAPTFEVHDLLNMPVFISPVGHSSRNLIQAALPEFQPRLESESADALVAMAQNGMGVSVVPSDSLPLHGYRYPELRAGAEAFAISYVVAQRRTSPLGSALDELAQALVESVERGDDTG